MIKEIVKHWFTASDGETYALGRALGVFVGMTCAPLPYAMLAYGKDVSLAELAVYVPAVAGAITLLITGTNPTEPK